MPSERQYAEWLPSSQRAAEQAVETWANGGDHRTRLRDDGRK